MDFGFCSKTAVFWTNLWIVVHTICSKSAEFEQFENSCFGRCNRSAMTVANFRLRRKQRHENVGNLKDSKQTIESAARGEMVRLMLLLRVVVSTSLSSLV